MEAREKLIKSLEGTAYLLLAFLSAGWSYFFYLILIHGEIVCREPNRTWLAVEFFLALAVVGFGMALFLKFLRKIKKEEAARE